MEGWPIVRHAMPELEDITAFIEGRTDDALIADLLWGLSLIDWQQVEKEPQGRASRSEFVPSSFYALLKLCFRPKGERQDNSTRSCDSSSRPLRRWTGCISTRRPSFARVGLPAARRKTSRGGYSRSSHRRALLFPVSPRDLSLLEQFIINQPENQT